MLIRNKEIKHLSYAERSLYKWINKKHNKGNVYEDWVFGDESRVYRVGKDIHYFYNDQYYEYSPQKNNQIYDASQQQKYRSRRNQW
jgi:hypothetical protein